MKRLSSPVVVLAVALPISAAANMGNLATNYGIYPQDIASAQALSLFNANVSATYYNPSQLVRDKRGELSAGLLHAEHSLKAVSLGGPNPPARNGDVLMDAPSQHVLIGMKTDLTSLTSYEKPLYFGFIAGVEKYGAEMMAFTSETSQEGQYLRYGRQPLFLNMGAGLELLRGIDVGIGARITLHSTASMQASSNLAGDTEHERLDVSAEPSIRPVAGITMDLGKLFCNDRCWMQGLELAGSYRAFSNTSTTVNANVTIDQVVLPPGMTMSITTLDSWQPDIVAAGLQYKQPRWRIGATLETQKWSKLGREFSGDTVKDQANLEFRDTVIPRLGFEFKPTTHTWVMLGVAHEKSPLKSTESLNVNYFDNDRTVVGAGFGIELPKPPIMAYPVRLDFGYQMHRLKAREFDMTWDTAPTNPYERVSSEGDVHVFSGALTLKF